MDHVVPHYDEDSANPRLQLKTDTVREEYSKLYDEQLRNIIEGYDVFHGNEDPITFNSSTTGKTKGRPQNKHMSSAPPVLKGHVEGLFPRYSSSAQYQNWKAKQTVLKGGANYQHPHSDNAIVNSYANLEVFPFVCIHGFGVDEFSLWLLPNPLQRHYGFEHKFGAKNMLLMRGDFVHAGCPGTNPRAHLEFFPREGAGWKFAWTTSLFPCQGMVYVSGSLAFSLVLNCHDLSWLVVVLSCLVLNWYCVVFYCPVLTLICLIYPCRKLVCLVLFSRDLP